MKQYVIDGNNVIGKIKKLKNLRQKDKQTSREKLVFMVDNFLRNKKVKCTIHFDGFGQTPVKSTLSKIIYSNDKTADEKIKIQIEQTKNRKNLIVVTSDNNIRDFAKVCSCEILKSSDFGRMIGHRSADSEQKKIDDMKNNEEEFKRLFGVDNN